MSYLKIIFMKIIRINPQAADGAKEKIVRVLTFANGSYALHLPTKKVRVSSHCMTGRDI